MIRRAENLLSGFTKKRPRQKEEKNGKEKKEGKRKGIREGKNRRVKS